MPCPSDTRCFQPLWKEKKEEKKRVLCGFGRLQMKRRTFLRSCLCVSAFNFSLVLRWANQEETVAACSRRTCCAGIKASCTPPWYKFMSQTQSWGLQVKWCFPLTPFPGACRVCTAECSRELEGPVSVLLNFGMVTWTVLGNSAEQDPLQRSGPTCVCTFTLMLN